MPGRGDRRADHSRSDEGQPDHGRPSAANLGVIGFPEDPDDGEAGYGSTDCGNVSQRLPTIHPYIRISPDGVPGHSREFAQWARSPMARLGMVAGAKALALTALDLLALARPNSRLRKKDFER